MSDTQEPKETINKAPGLEGKSYDHPAFGMIGASRIQGRAVLYGSDFIHQHFVVIRIRRSTLHRSLSRDWHSSNDELIEICLSEAQWATFVSSMNVGDGVPCTIEHVAGKSMPSIPFRKEEDEFHRELADDTAKIVAEIDAAIAEVEGEIGRSLSKAKRDRIIGRLQKARKIVDDEIPFAAKSFEEHMENTVEKAKVEVNAYVLGTIMKAGLAAIQGENLPPVIGFEEGESR
jgi:hypothetical protein